MKRSIIIVFTQIFVSVFIFQLAHMILPEDENFLLVFRRENPLDNTVEFMTVRSKITHESSAWHDLSIAHQQF